MRSTARNGTGPSPWAWPLLPFLASPILARACIGVALFAPIMILGFLTRAVLTLTLRARSGLSRPTAEWRPWYAWFPVTIGPRPGPEAAWMEWVERRAVGGHDAIEYRIRRPRAG